MRLTLEQLKLMIEKEADKKLLQAEDDLDEDAFTYKIAQAALDGKDKVTFGGKEHPVKMSKEKAKKIVGEAAKKKTKKKSKKEQPPHPRQYGAPEGSKRDKALDRAKELYAKGDIQGAVRAREKEEKRQQKLGVKSRPRKDTGRYTSKKESVMRMTESQLRETIRDVLLETLLMEKKKRKQQKGKKRAKKTTKRKSSGSSGALSAKTKETLKKKAKKRGLTPSSVYAEYRKGLAAWASSGSRKGMSQHQWAHARVNSANPSKSWAVVKKAKSS